MLIKEALDKHQAGVFIKHVLSFIPDITQELQTTHLPLLQLLSKQIIKKQQSTPWMESNTGPTQTERPAKLKVFLSKIPLMVIGTIETETRRHK